MPDYEIKIKTTAEGDGAKRTAEELKQLKAAADQTRGSIEKLDHATGKSAAESASVFTQNFQKENEAILKAGDAARAAAKDTDQLGVSKGKLASAVNKLAHEFPAFGYVVAAIKNPIALVTLGIVGLVQAFRRLGDQIKEVQSANNAWDVVLNSVRDLGSFSKESKEQARQFAEQLQAIGTGADAAAKGLAKVNDEIQRRNRLAAEQENADMAEDLAGIDLRESRQEISGSQASGLRATIRKKYAKRAADRAASALDEQGQQAQAAASGLHWKASQAEKSLPGMRAGLDKAQARQQEITAENQLLLGDDKTPGSFNKELADVDAEIAQQEAYQQGSFGGWGWKDALYPMLGKQKGEELARKQQAAPQALLELRRRKGRIFQQRKDAAERQRAIDRDVDRRKKQIATTESFATSGKQQAHELFETGKSQIDQAAQQREAGARRLQTEGRTLDLGTEADYTRELIEKANRNRHEQDRLNRGAGRGFLGAGAGSGAVQGVVGAVNDNGAAILAALSTVEAALRANTSSIQIAHARIAHTAGMMS